MLYIDVAASPAACRQGLVGDAHAARAGVFVYSKNSRVYTYVNSAMIGVYNASENDAEICLKKDGVYTDLISGDEYTCKNGILKLKKREINAYLLIMKNSLQK